MGEIDYIRDHYYEVCNLPGNFFCFKLKNLIFGDENAWPIFHADHLDVTKLRNGRDAFYRTYELAEEDRVKD